MSDPDRIDTLGTSPLVELRVKGSRFLARVHPAADRAAVVAAVERERAEFPDATHHCSAARLLDEERVDDDGEPGGTAGEPILRALQGAEVRAVCCVVTRYFGGTKLGTGGLVRAYGEAARDAVAAAPSATIWRTVPLAFSVEFDDLGAVEHVLRAHERTVHAVERTFEPDPGFVLTVRRSARPEIENALRDATAGRVRSEDPPQPPTSGPRTPGSS